MRPPGAREASAQSAAARPPPERTPPESVRPRPQRRDEVRAAVAARAEELERKVEAALEGIEERLQDLASRAGLGATRRELGEALGRLLPLLRQRLAAFGDLLRVLEPAGRLDHFGMDPRLEERAQPFLEFLYASWWRVEARAVERVPAAGPALVVANHGGPVPWDALVLRHALRRDHPACRDLRPLLDDRECDLPVFGRLAVRVGAVRASPEVADRILREGGLIGVFPEGSGVSAKPWRDRYRIQRFGRGGFAKVALRAGAPIVPCAIVGSEEAAPPIARTGWIADRLGLPTVGAANFLRLGPAGLLPLPSKWTLRFGDPIEVDREHGGADDLQRVNALTERVRSIIQEMLDEDVSARQSVFL